MSGGAPERFGAEDAFPAGPAAAPDRSGEPLLRSSEFRRGREEGWRRLERLLEIQEKSGLRSLSPDEVRSLPMLYRAAVSSLSVARALVLDRNLLLYLENLVFRAYLTVYGPRRGILESLAGFLRRGFPESVRGLRRPLIAAAAALLAGVVVGYALTAADPDDFHLMVPAELAGGRGPASSAAELRREELFAPWPGFANAFIAFANSLFRHNTQVGLLCFGLGFTLGVPTLLLLGWNGMVLGAFIALHAERGLAAEFLAWLSVHGVTEILAVLLCGAGGLAVAESIVFPGRLPRLESLAATGRTAAGCAAGCVGMFFLAGLLEGGVRQLIQSTPLRLAVGLATGAGWWLYFSRAGLDGGGRGDADADDGGGGGIGGGGVDVD